MCQNDSILAVKHPEPAAQDPDPTAPPPIFTLPPPALIRHLTQWRLRAAVLLSFGGMAVLLALEAAFRPPPALPHLFPTLNALYSCANLVVAYGIGVCWQWREGGDPRDGAEGGTRRLVAERKKRQ